MATTYKTHTGDGSDLIFDYPFPALKTEDVKVALNGGVQAATKYTVSLSPAQITFNNTSLNNTLQESTGAPKSGVEVRIFRNTEVDNPKGVFAAGNSVRAIDLNNNVDQALYALQEEKNQPLWDVAFEGGTIDGVTIGGTTPAAGTFSNLTISNLDSTIIGANTAAAGTFTTGTIATADINGGAIDGTTIGANTAAAGTFTTGTITTADINGGNIDGTTIGATTPAQGSFSRLILNQNPSRICSDTSDGSDNNSIIISGGGDITTGRGSTIASYGNEHTYAGNLDLYSGATSTGKITLSAGASSTLGLTIDQDGKAVIPTADINGGAIDGTVIGANTAAAGTFTTGSFNDITLTDSAVCNINTNTSDGSDDKALVVCGGGGGSSLRGGFVAFYGNESGSAGNVQLGSGKTSTGKVEIYAGPTPTLGLTIDQAGKAVIPTADINSGNIDGTTIGATTAAAGSFTEVNLLDNQKIKLGTNSTDDSEIYFTGNALTIKSDDDILIDADDALDIKSDSNQNFYVGETIRFQLHNTAEQITANWPIIPGADDTYDLGSESTQWQDIYIDGTAYLDSVDIDSGNIDGTTIGATGPVTGTFSTLKLSTTVGQISSNTDDGSDIKNLHLCGGGGTSNARGATIVLSGNEATNDGNLYLYSGAHTTGEVFIYAGDSTTLGLKVNQHGNVVIPTDLTVQGTLNVTGSTTTINTSTLEVEDKNITLAKVSTPTDTTADGGGITIKGATDKTFNWVDATDSFTSSEHIHLNGDNRKLILGAASTDASIYYDGTFLNLTSADEIKIDAADNVQIVATGSQEFKIGSDIRFWINNAVDSLVAGWPLIPGVDDTYDLGSSSLQWKDIYIDGTAYLDTVDIDAGAIDGTTIGATTPAAGDFTRVVLTAAPGKLVSNTADGSDNNIVAICGGGDTATSRGGIISLYGNETSSTPGDVFISSGQVSTGKIKFHTGSSSTLGLTIDENQKVGIGTTTPTNALDVQGGTSNTAIVARSTDAKAQISLVDNTTTGVGHVVIGAEGDALFLTSGAGVTALTIDENQKIGIGTTSPSRSLHISNNGSDGTQLQITGTSDSAGIKFVPASGDTFEYQAVATGCYVAYNRTDSRGDIFVDGNGKVGLGTASPSRQLHIHEPSAASAYLHMTNDTTGSATTDGFSLYVGTDGQTYYRARETTGTHRFYTGATEALTIASDGGATFTGNIYTGGNVNLTADNKKIRFGAGEDLQIWHGESNSGNNENANYISCASGRNLIVQVQDDANGIVFHKRTGTGLFNFEALASFTAGGSNAFYYDGVKQCETNSGGMNWADGKRAYFGNSSDLQIYHDSSDSYLINTTGNLYQRTTGNLYLQVNGGSNENAIVAKTNGAVELYHDNQLKFKTHASGAEIRSQEGEDANLYFYADEGDDHADMWLVQAESDGFFALKNYANSAWEMSLKATGANNVELYYDNSLKFDTQSDGVKVYGYLYTNDANRICMGNSADLQLFHDGSNSNIKNSTGWLNVYAGGSGFSIGNGDFSENLFKAANDGAVELYWAGTSPGKKLETYANGIQVTGSIKIPDSEILRLGNATNGDLKIYFDGTHSRIAHIPATGDLVIQSDDLYLTNGAGTEYYLRGTQNGAVKLYYDSGTYSTAKLETTAGGVNVTGNLLVSTSTSGGVATIWNTDQTSQTLLSLKDTGSGAGNHSQIEFHTVNGQAGNIVSNNVSVAYNTSSDYRLKENEVAISDGITRLKTLKPYRFNFKTEPSKTVDGFFAHEVTPAVPEAITGEKDGTEMQGIDQSKLVPLLTAALQEAIAKIEVLETKVAALEAG